jgi:uncharacterized protein
MNIISITDLHGRFEISGLLEEKMKTANLVLITGDITHFGKEDEIHHLIEKIKSFNPNILAVPGNCDYPEVDSYLKKHSVSLNRKVLGFNGLQFAGLGGSLPCPVDTPLEFSDNKLQEFIEKDIIPFLSGKPFIFVTHQPPYNTITDIVSGGNHVGSKTIRNFIEEHKPVAVFCGHIHEATGIGDIAGTKIANPGPLATKSYTEAVITDKLEKMTIQSF